VWLHRELVARQRPGWQVRPQQLERMDADGEARRPVVGEHPLPDRRLRQLRRLRRRIERQGELALLAAGTGNALRAGHEPELPEELAPFETEAVARTALDQRLHVQRRALDQVADRRVRAVALSLLDDCL